jgi:hypothetical protein
VSKKRLSHFIIGPGKKFACDSTVVGVPTAANISAIASVPLFVATRGAPVASVIVIIDSVFAMLLLTLASFGPQLFLCSPLLSVLLLLWLGSLLLLPSLLLQKALLLLVFYTFLASPFL